MEGRPCDGWPSLLPIQTDKHEYINILLTNSKAIMTVNDMAKKCKVLPPALFFIYLSHYGSIHVWQWYRLVVFLVQSQVLYHRLDSVGGFSNVYINLVNRGCRKLSIIDTRLLLTSKISPSELCSFMEGILF